MLKKDIEQAKRAISANPKNKHLVSYKRSIIEVRKNDIAKRKKNIEFLKNQLKNLQVN